MRYYLELLTVGVASIALAGCVTTAPSTSTHMTPEDWARIIQNDRAMVRAGASPALIQYDLEMQRLAPEGEAILASGDKVKMRAFSKKFSAVASARDAAIVDFGVKQAKNKPATGPACTGPFGKSLCGSSAPQGSDTQPGYNSWCQDPGDATQLVPCNQ